MALNYSPETRKIGGDLVPALKERSESSGVRPSLLTERLPLSVLKHHFESVLNANESNFLYRIEQAISFVKESINAKQPTATVGGAIVQNVSTLYRAMHEVTAGIVDAVEERASVPNKNRSYLRQMVDIQNAERDDRLSFILSSALKKHLLYIGKQMLCGTLPLYVNKSDTGNETYAHPWSYADFVSYLQQFKAGASATDYPLDNKFYQSIIDQLNAHFDTEIVRIVSLHRTDARSHSPSTASIETQLYVMLENRAGSEQNAPIDKIPVKNKNTAEAFSLDICSSAALDRQFANLSIDTVKKYFYVDDSLFQNPSAPYLDTVQKIKRNIVPNASLFSLPELVSLCRYLADANIISHFFDCSEYGSMFKDLLVRRLKMYSAMHGTGKTITLFSSLPHFACTALKDSATGEDGFLVTDENRTLNSSTLSEWMNNLTEREFYKPSTVNKLRQVARATFTLNGIKGVIALCDAYIEKGFFQTSARPFDDALNFFFPARVYPAKSPLEKMLNRRLKMLIVNDIGLCLDEICLLNEREVSHLISDDLLLYITKTIAQKYGRALREIGITKTLSVFNEHRENLSLILNREALTAWTRDIHTGVSPEFYKDYLIRFTQPNSLVQ